MEMRGWHVDNNGSNGRGRCLFESNTICAHIQCSLLVIASKGIKVHFSRSCVACDTAPPPSPTVAIFLWWLYKYHPIPKTLHHPHRRTEIVQRRVVHRKAATRAPRPRRTPDATWTLSAAPLEAAALAALVDDAAPPVVVVPVAPVAVTTEPEATPADAPVTTLASVFTAPPRTTVVELPMLTMKLLAEVFPAAMTMVVMPSGRPAGIVATSGWVVTATPATACEVTTDGWPVTTP